jgi:hypothetical protein
MMQKDLAVPGDPVIHGKGQGAAPEAERVSLFINMGKEIVGAAPSHHFGVLVSRDPLGALAPVGDPPVPVDKIHAVVQIVEQFLVKFFISF